MVDCLLVCLSLVSSEGAVWGWGSNTEGQLGLGEHGEETVHSPTRLPFTHKVSLEPLFTRISQHYRKLDFSA